MKKLTALLLALVMCLSLAACSGNSNAELIARYENRIAELEETIREYEEILNAGSDEENTEPVETEPQETRIEITTDNWQDYFEVKQFLSVDRVKNDFGEQRAVDIRLMTMFVLKKGLDANFDSTDKTDVAIQYDADYCYRDMTCDLEDYTYELMNGCQHEEDYSPVDEDYFVRGKTDSLSLGFYVVERDRLDGEKVVEDVYAPYGTLIWVAYYPNPVEEKEDGLYCIRGLPTNIQITRIEGWLTLNN